MTAITAQPASAHAHHGTEIVPPDRVLIRSDSADPNSPYSPICIALYASSATKLAATPGIRPRPCTT